MVKSKGATPGAILSTTPGATPRQRPVNGGATHTPYTPSVAPALGGWVHATNGGRHLVPVPPFPSGYETGGLTSAFTLCRPLSIIGSIEKALSAALHSGCFNCIIHSLEIENNISVRTIQFWQRDSDLGSHRGPKATKVKGLGKYRTFFERLITYEGLLVRQHFKVLCSSERPDFKIKSYKCGFTPRNGWLAVAFYAQRKLRVITSQSEFGRFNSTPISSNRGCRNCSDKYVTAIIFNNPSCRLVSHDTCGYHRQNTGDRLHRTFLSNTNDWRLA